MKYIDSEKIITEVEKRLKSLHEWKIGWERKLPLSRNKTCYKNFGKESAYDAMLNIINSLQEEAPDKETILRICKLHKAWSIMAPWENVEDFVRTNWDSENIV